MGRRIGRKIEHCEQFVVLISDNSVNSKYVRKEVGMAMDLDKNVLVVYLTETMLSSGLQLLLGDIQAIHMNSYSQKDDFREAFCRSLSTATLYQSQKSVFFDMQEIQTGSAKAEFLKTYNMLDKIGEGGIGQVYLTEHKRTRAMYVVRCGTIDETFLGKATQKCFEAERHILTAMMKNACPYMPTLVDWYQDEKNVFLVETRISGQLLKRAEPCSEKEVVDIAKKILKILRYVHNNGIVFRDIKPLNIMEDAYGELYLIDFNAAKFIDDDDAALVGSVAFCSPEQLEKTGKTDPSSDIFALGRTMINLLCPREFRKNEKAPIRFLRKDISVELESIILKMTAHEQCDRYQTVDEVLVALDDYKCKNPLKKLSLLIKSSKYSKAYQNEITVNEKKQASMISAMEDELYRNNTTSAKLPFSPMPQVMSPRPSMPAPMPLPTDYVGASFYDTVILPNQNLYNMDDGE